MVQQAISGQDMPASAPRTGGFLARETIRRRLAAREVVPEPDSKSELKVRESHLELHLGSEAFVTREKLPVLLTDEEPFLTIPSGEFALLTTHEAVVLPPDLLGFISIRFRYKILGLLNVSGFHVDPGYRGKIIFSVYNLGPSDVVLRFRDSMFLLFLAPLSESVSRPRQAGDEHFQDVKHLPGEYVTTLKGTSVSLTTLNNRIDQLETVLKIAAGLLLPIVAILVTIIVRTVFKGQ